MRPTSRTASRTASAVLSLLLAPLLLLGSTPSAHAADIYRYWTYFTVTDGEFVASMEGPGATTPKDGGIEAYRYAAPANYKKPNLPRADLSVVTFDSVCGDAEAAEGEKRVAVLIDYGVEADQAQGDELPQPEAGCAVVPEDATGLQTLQAVAPDLRTKKSSYGPMLCGINGYPSEGCADVLAESGTPADAEAVDFTVAGSEDSAEAAGEDTVEEESNNALLLGGLALLVVLLAGGGVLMSRRNRA